MVVRLITILFFLFTTLVPVRAQDAAAPTSSSPSPVVEKEIEVAMGIDVIEKVDFDFNPKMTIGNELLLRLILVPQKREIIVKGLKPGKTTILIRDNLGDVRLKYTVSVTASGKSNIVAELRELIGDIEGIEIGIKGGKVFVGGEIVVPDDIGRLSAVLMNYKEALVIVELSPQTQRVIARKMTDELAKNNLKDVTVRIVNKDYWLEGVVSSDGKKKLAVEITKAFLPPTISSLSTIASDRYDGKDKPGEILDFIAVNEKKEPQPAPKMVKITAQFVELTKNYGKVFAFKWAPLMGQDNSEIQIGQTGQGNVTSSSSGTLSATISNLFPKLNAAKTAGYARIIQSGMVITRDQKQAQLNKLTNTPYSVGTGEFTKAAMATIGLNLSVTPRILEQEKVELQMTFSVDVTVGSDASIITNNSINTNIIVKSKESAAMGGVVQNQSVTDYDKTDPAPINANAGGQVASPLFRLLRSKNYTTSKTQFVMFVTPEVIESASVGTEEIRKKFRRRE